MEQQARRTPNPNRDRQAMSSVQALWAPTVRPELVLDVTLWGHNEGIRAAGVSGVSNFSDSYRRHVRRHPLSVMIFLRVAASCKAQGWVRIWGGGGGGGGFTERTLPKARGGGGGGG